jgi:hypothetical protein
MRLAALTFAVLAFAAPALAPARAEPKDGAAGRQWEGDFADGKLRRLLPKGGVIADAKTFAKVWKAWRPREKVREVDFAKELLVAACCGEGDRPVLRSVVLKGGELGVTWGEERRGRGVHGYAIVAISRKGVKKVNGVPLTRPKPEEPPEK